MEKTCSKKKNYFAKPDTKSRNTYLPQIEEGSTHFTEVAYCETVVIPIFMYFFETLKESVIEDDIALIMRSTSGKLIKRNSNIFLN